MTRMPSFSSLNKPGSRLLHLSQGNQERLLSSNFSSSTGLIASSNLAVCKGKVHAVSVHLDEFKVSPFEVVVQELVVELEHAELGELVYDYANLEGTVDCYLGFARIDLVNITNHLQVLKPCRAELPVELSLILGVRRFVLPLHTLDELAVRAGTQSLNTSAITALSLSASPAGRLSATSFTNQLKIFWGL